MIGKVLGNRYEIIEKIGGGGMSVVYKARCRVLNRYVAIKILRNELISDPNFVEKFKQESLSAASLNHPNIVNIYDTGIEDNIYYIVMEYIKGETLKDLITRKGHLSDVETIKISIQIAEALKHAHTNGIVHRDIKPHNILITEEGIVKVADFGIARAATTSTINSTSNVIGSVHYFSPEQARGGYVDEKSDIYSLGVVMYEMVTGVVPFDADNHISVAMKHLHDEVVPPSQKVEGITVPEELEKIILKCLQKHQSYRYQNAGELLKSLYVLQSEKPINLEENNNYLDDLDSPTIIMPKIDSTNREQIEKSTNHKNNNDEKPKSESEDALNKFLDNDNSVNSSTSNNVKNNKMAASNKVVDDEDIDTDDSEEEEELDEDKNSRKIRREMKKKAKKEKKALLKKDPNYKKKKKITWAAIGSAIALVAIIGFLVFKFFIIVPEVEVPELVGLTEDEAKTAIKKAGLVMKVTDRDYNDEYDEDVIYEQSEEPGSKVKKNYPIGVSISKGTEASVVPDIVGKFAVEAGAMLKEQDLEEGEVTKEFNDDVPEGKIISQSPKADEKVDPGTKIDYVVSQGPETEMVTVPSLLGITLNAAKTKLDKYSLFTGDITYENSNDYAANIVISQSIPAGSQVEVNSTVNIVVSLGKKAEDTTQNPPTNNNQGSTQKPTENPPTQQPETPKESVQQINVPLPKDKEKVAVIVYKITDSGKEIVFNDTVSTAEGSYLVNVQGSGTQSFQVYVDGAVLHGADGKDVIPVTFN